MRLGERTVGRPEREPFDVVLTSTISAAVVFGMLVALWPPTWVYWVSLANMIGDTPTLAVVAILALGAGVWFARTSGFRPAAILSGSIVGYSVCMFAIEVGLDPASPVHFLWYGMLVGSVLGGAVLWWTAQKLAD